MYWIFLIGSGFLVFAITNFFTVFKPAPAYIPQEAVIYLTFENNGQGRIFAGEVVQNMTILEALYAASLVGNIGFDYTVDSTGEKIFIKSVGDYSAVKSKKSLVIYLNHAKINSDNINVIHIQPGDIITLTLE